jgi:hypothetical protein
VSEEEHSLSISLFDPEHGLHADARRDATLLFDGAASRVVGEGARMAPQDGGWIAELAGELSVELRPLAEPARLGGVTAHVCEVRGTVGRQKVRCLGTVSETKEPPAWAELDAIRAVSALFDPRNAFLALARRPRGAPGHGTELVTGWLLREGEVLSVEDARISTVYDGEGRQRSAGLELWLPGEDFPRRGSGTVVAGSSLQLEGIDVHAAIFRWRMEDLEGSGAYQLWVRSDPVAA